jgi:hypothetical protein
LAPHNFLTPSKSLIQRCCVVAFIIRYMEWTICAFLTLFYIQNLYLFGSYKFCTYWFIQILYLLVHTNSVFIGSYKFCTYWFIQTLFLLVHTNSVLIGSCKFCTYWFSTEFVWTKNAQILYEPISTDFVRTNKYRFCMNQ